MSKHSLISAGLGLGLMAASLGANAQMLHSFDYSSMYYGSAAGGAKYVAFMPTSQRAVSNSDYTETAMGAAGVLMLELFQPISGSASTWAYAIGGPVVSAEGMGATTGAWADGSASIAFTANNGIAQTFNFYPGNNASISKAFLANVAGVSGQQCVVNYNAVIDANDQLRLGVTVSPSLAAWSAAAGDLSFYSNSGSTNAVTTIASTAWNAGDVSLAGNFSGTAAGASGFAASTAGTVVGAIVNAHNRCVAVYNSRKSSSTDVITGGSLGMLRLW